MALTPITITWADGNEPVIAPDGSKPSGAIELTLADPTTGLPVTIEDSSSGQTVQPLVVVGQLISGVLQAQPVGGGPYEPLTLIANDDPTTVPVGTVYVVHEQLAAGSKPDWHLTVHHDAVGATESIASQRPA